MSLSISTNMFFLIGAMKSATSSLHSYLEAHPQLYACPTKEPRFFLKEQPTEDEWLSYCQLFKGHTNEAWTFESTTGYSKVPLRPGVAQRIHARFPDARLVYIVRDPINRIYSHYLHNFCRGRETRSFADAVRSDSEYIDISRFFMQTSEYLKYFSREQMHVVLMEDLVKVKIDVLRQVFDFLDVDPDFVPPNLEQVVNRTASQTMLPSSLQRLDYKSQTIQTSLMRQRFIGSALRRLSAPLGLLRRPVPSRSDIQDPDTEQYILDALGDDVDQLCAFLGRDLDEWPTVQLAAKNTCRQSASVQ